jgi:hypothetical protein
MDEVGLTLRLGPYTFNPCIINPTVLKRRESANNERERESKSEERCLIV